MARGNYSRGSHMSGHFRSSPSRGPVRVRRWSGRVLELLERRELLSAYFVSWSAGNDDNAGTAAAPWRTLQHAANRVRAGDVITVRAGLYDGFQLTTDGTEAAPIRFLAEPGVTITRANPR